MKKLKSFLCLALMFIAGSMMLVACGPNNDNPPADTPTTTTITLAEAKQTIVNALAIDNTQVQTLSVALANDSTDTGNRNLFNKISLWSYTSESTGVGVDTNSTINVTSLQVGTCEYANGQFSKGLMKITSNQAYMSEYNIYIENGTGYMKFEEMINTVPMENSNSYIDILACAFEDYYFENAYDSTVNKTTTNSGYSLTLKMDILKFSEIANISYMDESFINALTQELKDFQSVSITIEFDNNNQIVGANIGYSIIVKQPTIDMTSYEYIKTTANCHIVKTDTRTTTPQWVTDYISSQN